MDAAYGWRKGTPEYQAYYHALNRCNNPKDENYPDYGGRGIKFLFTSFEQFFAELGSKPSHGHSLDRIRNDGHYEPGNVHWATGKEQRANQRPHRPPKKHKNPGMTERWKDPVYRKRNLDARAAAREKRTPCQS
jgi:hypothetical protein